VKTEVCMAFLELLNKVFFDNYLNVTHIAFIPPKEEPF
jgi:hypothetical protein